MISSQEIVRVLGTTTSSTLPGISPDSHLASIPSHPVFWLMVAAVAAPLLASIPLGIKIPVVVLEILLGIVIGPHCLGLVSFDGFIAMMFTYGMGATLFMAGMELDLPNIKGRSLSLAVKGWGLSLLLSAVSITLLHFLPHLQTPLLVILTLCTTGLGVLVPLLRDGDQLSTPFGRLVMAAGTIGEVAPIIMISLLLSPKYNTWLEIGFLIVFLSILSGIFAIGIGVRPPGLLRFLGKHLRTSSQLPVRISLLIIATLAVTAEEFGFERIFGTFAAGMILGQGTREGDGIVLREKIEAICFGWFYPFFFIGTGLKFDLSALTQNLRTMLMIPLFLSLFLIIRGGSVFLYGHSLDRSQKLPFALFVAVPSISLLVVITQIGLETKMINNDIATALISAALLAVLLFPTLAQGLLSRLDSSQTE